MNGIVSLIQAMRNPSQFLQTMMANSRVTSNPMAMNAFKLAQNGDNKGLEQLARNLCKQNGVDVDNAVSQVRQRMGRMI